MNYRYFKQDDVEMIEIEVDPTNKVCRVVTETDANIYPREPEPKHKAKHAKEE